MANLRMNSQTMRYTVTAVVALTLAGCSANSRMAQLSDAPAPSQTKLDKQQQRDAGKNIAAAEKAVLRQPRSASLRAQLGLAYLQSGRFASASTAYDDAMKLGDNSPHTALGLALAAIGSGNSNAATSILNDWRDSIPVSDLGLALALAGESGRGVAILTDALRGGENTPKLRQNLAYALALDGKWREARTMMQQDVPADVIDQRISDWAMTGRSEDFQKRVAGLLSVPVRPDSGMPRQLALVGTAAVEQAAAEATAVQPAVAEQSAVAAQMPQAPSPLDVAVGNAPEVAPEVAVAEPVQPSVADYQPAQVSGPVVQSTFASPAVPYAASVRSASQRQPNRTVRLTMPTPKTVVTRSGSHLVQLGSYSSPQGARRGWGVMAARNPSLREFRMVITPAVVNGKNYWRVAAAGFDQRSAANMCSSVKNRGGACFSYAANNAPAGATMASSQKGATPQLARNR